MGQRHDPSLDLENPERRAFALQSVLLLLSGVTITVSGCGDDGSPPSPSPGPTPGAGDVVGNVAANHGHTAVIESARLTGNMGIVLMIRGSATHPHTVELSSQEVSQIAARQRVSKLSSTDDSPDAGRHNHLVTFN